MLIPPFQLRLAQRASVPSGRRFAACRHRGRSAMARKASASPLSRGVPGGAREEQPAWRWPAWSRLHGHSPGPWTMRPLVHGQEGSPWLCVSRRPRPGSSPVQLLGSSGLKQVDLGPSSPPAATGPHARLHTYPSDRKHAGPAQPPPPTSHLHRQAGRRGQHPAFLRRGSRVPGEPARPLVPPRPLLPSAAS